MVASNVFAVTTLQTNVPVIDQGKDLYAENAYGVAKQVVGINSAGRMSIDEAGLGVIFGAGATFNAFVTLVQESSVSSNATTNATVTAVGSYQILGTWLHQDVTTVNAITTANISIGSIVIFRTVADAQDIVFSESDNLSMGGATRTLDDADDIIGFIKATAHKFVEIFFVSNN